MRGRVGLDGRPWGRWDRVPPRWEPREQDAGDHQGPPCHSSPPSPLRLIQIHLVRLMPLGRPFVCSPWELLDPDFLVYPGWQAAPEVECHGAGMPEAGRCCYVGVVVFFKLGRKVHVPAIFVGDTQEQILASTLTAGAPENGGLTAGQGSAPLP